MLGPPDEFSRRVARNTVLILQEEAHLHRVLDPAGGSWFLDRLTEQIAEEAWNVFQEVERQGGMLKALQSGSVHQQIEAAFTPRAKNIASRKEGITGVSEFPNLSEEQIPPREISRAAIRMAAIDRVEQGRALEYALSAVANDPTSTEAAITAASNGASIGQLATALGFHTKSNRNHAAGGSLFCRAIRKTPRAPAMPGKRAMTGARWYFWPIWDHSPITRLGQRIQKTFSKQVGSKSSRTVDFPMPRRRPRRSRTVERR